MGGKVKPETAHSYYIKNKSRILSIKKAYYNANKESLLKKRREYRSKNRIKISEIRKLKYLEGLKDHDYKKKYKANKLAYYYKNKDKINKKLKDKRASLILLKAGRPKPEFCEVCNKLGKIVWDHNHKTGTFRGWICSHCNCVLGFSYDSIEILEKLILYLKNSHE